MDTMTKRGLAAGLVGSAVLLLGHGARAAEGEQASCADISELAANIMESRQSGTAMADMMTLADGAGSASDLIEAMVVSAYEMPRFQTPTHQRRQVAEYRDAWHLRCVKARQ